MQTQTFAYMSQSVVLYTVRTSYGEDETATVDDEGAPAAVTVVEIISMGNRRPPFE